MGVKWRSNEGQTKVTLPADPTTHMTTTEPQPRQPDGRFAETPEAVEQSVELGADPMGDEITQGCIWAADRDVDVNDYLTLRAAGATHAQVVELLIESHESEWQHPYYDPGDWYHKNLGATDSFDIAGIVREGATIAEIFQARENGAWMELYVGVRSHGATHDEWKDLYSSVGNDVEFSYHYGQNRLGGDSHFEAMGWNEWD